MSDLDRVLDQFARRLEAAIEAGLEPAAATLEGLVVATDAFGDDTGATRGSSFAAVASERTATRAARRGREAFAEAARLNPGTEEANELKVPDGAIRVVATSMTSYAADLERERGGDQAFLEETMRLEAPYLQQAGVQALREVLG